MRGKSMTHKNFHSFGSRSFTPRFSKRVADSSRVRPRMLQALSHGPAAKNTMSPLSTFSLDFNVSCSESERNLRIGDFHSPFSDLIKASPLAPSDLAVSSRCLSSPWVMLASPLALKALTAPPDDTAPANTLKSEFRKSSEKSTISKSKRMSGLSLPKRFIASSKGMRRKGVWISSPKVFCQTSFSSPSMRAYMSSLSIKDISKSTWVNSGCRSARRSSSRKQRAS